MAHTSIARSTVAHSEFQSQCRRSRSPYVVQKQRLLSPASATLPSSSPRTSLVPETLEFMETDVELITQLQQLSAKGQAALTREEKKKRQRSLDALGAPSFYAVAKVCKVCRSVGAVWCHFRNIWHGLVYGM